MVELLYFTLRQWPQHWWILAWALFMGLFIVLAQLAPVVLFPIFYKFEPLDNEDLRRRLVVLSERAGTRVRGVYRWKLSEKSKKANAALTGLGATRRIILADTLLDNYSPEEIEAVLAHELGHHVHRHILKSIFVQAAITLFGFWAANWTLHYAVDLHMFEELSDFANLPLLALVSVVLSFLLMPALNAFSRFNERQADRYAFESIASVRTVHLLDEQTGGTESRRADSFEVGGVVFPFASRHLEATSGRAGVEPQTPGCAFLSGAVLQQLSFSQNFDHALQIFFCVDTHAVVRRLPNIDRDAVLQEAQLLQTLTLFECGLRKRHKAVERGFAVGVQAEVLKVAGLRAIAIERDGGTGKIKGAAAEIGYDFHGVRIRDVDFGGRRHQRTDLRGGIFHDLQ